MYLTIFEEVEKSGPEIAPIDAASLYRAFEKVKDGRGKKGKRYPLPLLLTLLLLGKLAGETSINGIVDWIKERKGWLKRQLDWPKNFAVNSTYSEALAQCDAQAIAQAIAQVILKARAMPEGDPALSRGEQAEQEKRIHTAMDGMPYRIVCNDE
jgi:DDE_Tnp_1-associated